MSSLGVLSSGLGGLLFLRELEKRQQGVGFVYWGDTASCPWGSRSFEWASGRAQEGGWVLEGRGVCVLGGGGGGGLLCVLVGARAPPGGGPRKREPRRPPPPT